MLKTNLSTRPFYNTRLVGLALIGAAIVLAVISALHLVWAVSLANEEGILSARATEARTQAGELRADAERLRKRVDPKELETVSAAAREANAVIEQRTFSWGQLLSHLEATVPDDVRITAVTPKIDDEGVTVTLSVEAQNVEHLSAFMDALEKSGAFRNVWPTTRQTGDDDVIDAVVEGRYTPIANAVPAAPKTVGKVKP
ncbi:MAG TPA: PilN domain-containing protein [Vicinamibacterales bacterium]|nr:PilN domain-containing protein [Vicinamibacterales bacterium]